MEDMRSWPNVIWMWVVRSFAYFWLLLALTEFFGDATRTWSLIRFSALLIAKQFCPYNTSIATAWNRLDTSAMAMLSYGKFAARVVEGASAIG